MLQIKVKQRNKITLTNSLRFTRMRDMMQGNR